MKLSVWYNTNLNKFYVTYNQTFSRFPSGYINEFGHIHVQSIFSNDNNIFYNTETYLQFIEEEAENKSISYRLGEQIENIATWLMRRK